MLYSDNLVQVEQWVWLSITMQYRELLLLSLVIDVTNGNRGTEKQHVANDYATRLHIGQVECEVSGRGLH